MMVDVVNGKEFDSKYVEKILDEVSKKDKTEISNEHLQQRRIEIGAYFNCEIKDASNSTPISVNALRPADIGVVAAIGDSLTVRISFSLFLVNNGI